MIQLFQISFSRDLIERINRGEKVPAHDAHLKARCLGQFPGREWYTHIADIDTSDLDYAFEIGNIGPESKLTRHAPMYSVSVGDVLVANGTAFIVKSVGFEAISNWS